MSVDQPRAILRLYRKAHGMSAKHPMRLLVDNQIIGEVSNDDTLIVDVEPGRRVLRIFWNRGASSRPVTANCRPGHTYDFTCAPRPTGWKHIVALDQVASASDAPLPMQRPSAAVAPANLDAANQVIEHQPVEESLSEEIRIIDNSRSAAAMSRTLKISREWSRTLTIGFEEVRSRGGELSAGPAWMNVKGNVERTLHSTYSADINSRQQLEEEISLTVPPWTIVQLTLRWKRLWQHGVVLVVSSGQATDIAYRVVAGITFDQSTHDLRR
jgi:hypothetical protein